MSGLGVPVVRDVEGLELAGHPDAVLAEADASPGNHPDLSVCHILFQRRCVPYFFSGDFNLYIFFKGRCVSYFFSGEVPFIILFMPFILFRLQMYTQNKSIYTCRKEGGKTQKESVRRDSNKNKTI